MRVYFRTQEDTSLTEDSKPKLMNRLRRIEGQVRGVARMVEEDRYCIDILTQIQALRAALAKVETELLRGHVEHCVRGAFTFGDAEDQRKKIEELVEVVQRGAR
jgi:DNA-binding FrmR family transcriptional regulator